jgi:hypothetical protein
MEFQSGTSSEDKDAEGDDEVDDCILDGTMILKMAQVYNTDGCQC